VQNLFECLEQEQNGVELCAKRHHQLELLRGEKDKDFGFKVGSEFGDAADESDLSVFVCDVTRGGLAAKKG